MKNISQSIFPLFILVLLIACQNKPRQQAEYIPIIPEYKPIDLYTTQDTIKFSLSETSTTAITSVNYFIADGKEYLSTYDRVSKQINLYTFPGAFLLKSIPLKQWLKGTNLDKASIYVQNFDSILVCTKSRLVLMDSTSRIKNDIQIERKIPIRIPDMDNEIPPVIKNGVLFTSITPAISEQSVPEHKRWKLLFGFDLKTDEKKVYYQLPEVYRENLYGYAFLRYSYCINDKGHFVFSFPADTNLYETDLEEYNRSYFAKSKYQHGDILPIDKETIEKGFSYREYSLRDSYGAIFFDPSKRRYLRVAKQKMSDSSFMARERVRNRSMVFLDEQFKVVGEGKIPDSVNIGSLFFTNQGNMFVMLNGVKEPCITYVRLDYRYHDPGDLAKHNNER